MTSRRLVILKIHHIFVEVKKILVFLLAVIYLGVSSGVAMNIHYCMGKIASVDLFHHSDKCGKCGMKTSGGCCKDEFKIIKLNDSHKLISNEINTSSPVTVIDNSHSEFDCGLHFSEVPVLTNNNSPPEPSGFSLCIRNCIFRI